MGVLLQNNWPWIVVIVVAFTVLLVLLWRNFDIEEITPTPPFVKLKRKAKAGTGSGAASTNVTGNTMWGRNKISARREGSNVSDNTMLGENEIEVGAKPCRKPKRRKNR